MIFRRPTLIILVTMHKTDPLAQNFIRDFIPEAREHLAEAEMLLADFAAIVKIGVDIFGLIADNVIGIEEILVKPLPRVFAACGCCSGVTILGDGSVAMILDAAGMRT